MMREFCAFGEPLRFDRELRRTLLKQLSSSNDLGRLWVIDLDGAPVGYVVLTFGYSFEYEGRDALIDELFVKEELRGRGIGRQTIDFLSEACRSLGIRALHLEVDHDNTNAQRLYRNSGFEGNQRSLLTKWLMTGDKK